MQRARSLCNTSSDAANFRIPARYKFSKLLGSGSYGVVAAFYDSCRGREVAVKRVRRVFDNFLVLRRTLREIRLMRHFRHPNILRLHKVLPMEGNTGDLHLSLELMDCDLDTLIHARHVALSDHQVRRFLAQMLLGLMNLHSGHVLHRDLKPANIFVRLSRGQVKLGDLGLSRGVAVDDDSGEATHPSDELLTEYVVTRWYRAPEVLLARSKYGPAVDVWSIGCILYEMWARKALFPGKNSYDQLRRVICVLGTPSEADCAWVPPESVSLLQRCCQPSSEDSSGQPRMMAPAWSSLSGLASVSANGADLLKRMCTFDPNKRITIEDALQHPYLAGLTTREDLEVARAVAPADVAYDRMYDGIGRSGESAALLQLSRMLRREVARDGPRDDASPDHSPARSPRDAKAVSAPKPFTPRGGANLHVGEDRLHPSSSAVSVAAVTPEMSVGSTHSLHERPRSRQATPNRSARGSNGYRDAGSTARASSRGLNPANADAPGVQSRPVLGSSGSCQSVSSRTQYRRSSDGDVDSKGRRALGAMGAPSLTTRTTTAAAAAVPGKRRASEPVGAQGLAEQQLPQPPPAFYELAVAEVAREAVAEDVQPPFWQMEDLKDAVARQQQQMSRMAVEYSAAPLRRRDVGHGNRAPVGCSLPTTHSEAPDGRRATPRATSSRQNSLSRAYVRSSSQQRIESSEGASGLAHAANASPRISPPRMPFEDTLPPAPSSGSTARAPLVGAAATRGGTIKATRDPSPTTATTRTPGSSKPTSAQSNNGGFFEAHGNSNRAGVFLPAPPWQDASPPPTNGALNDSIERDSRPVLQDDGIADARRSEASRMASLLDEMLRSANSRQDTSPRPRKASTSVRRSSGGPSARGHGSSSRGPGNRGSGKAAADTSPQRRHADTSPQRRTGGPDTSPRRRHADTSPQRRYAEISPPRRHAWAGGDELDFAVCEPQVQAKRSVTPRRSSPSAATAHAAAARQAAQQAAAAQHAANAAATLATQAQAQVIGLEELPVPPWLEAQDPSPEPDSTQQAAVAVGARLPMPWDATRRKGSRQMDFADSAKSLQSSFDASAMRTDRSGRGTPPRHRPGDNGPGGGLTFAF